MNRRTWTAAAAWTLIGAMLIPVLFAAYVSFTPDTLLTPPTTTWSLRWYRAFAGDSRWKAAAVRSLIVAASSALLSIAAAFPAAIGTQDAASRSGRVLKLALLLPALLPPAAFGTGLLPLVYWSRLWGSLASLVLAHGALGLPVAYLILLTHRTSQLADLESAAAGLGAGRWQILFRVTLPLMRPAILTAAISVFVLSLNESLITIFLATPQNETLPAVVWPQLRYSPSPLVAVASCITSIVGMLAIWLIAFSRRQPHEPPRGEFP